MKQILLLLCLIWSISYPIDSLGSVTPELIVRLSGSTLTPTSTTVVVPTGDIWYYLVTASEPALSWKSDLLFADKTPPWYAGKSPLGYGNQGSGASLTTVVGEGGTCVNECVSNTAVTNPSCLTCASRSITTYFRKVISLTNVAGSSFSLRYQKDDAIAIYINGVELVRDNLPTGVTITYSTTALTIQSDPDELTWVSASNLTASWFREGQNLIAAEVHQIGSGSSDIRFNLELQQTPLAGTTLARGPYLQRYSDNPNLVIPADKRSMTLRWSTTTATNGQVIYRVKPATGTLPGSTTITPLQAPTPYSWTVSTGTPAVSGTVTLYDASVTLTDLQPDTPYSYTIKSGTFWQGDETNYFRTPPLTGSSKKTRMWVLGDFGKEVSPGSEVDGEQVKVMNSFNKYVKTTLPGTDNYIDLWLWLGDNAYGWGLPEQFQKYVFDVYDSRDSYVSSQRSATFGPQWIMKQTPIYAVPGNHDYHQGGSSFTAVATTEVHRKDHSKNHYFNVVNTMTVGENEGVHSGKEEYYSFDHANIHFVSLDSYGYQKTASGALETSVFPANGVQLTWLKQDLDRAQKSAKIKWIVVYVHHPPYTITAGSHNSDTEQELTDIRERLVRDVLEKYKVDLVMSGHSHTYQRSWPIQGHYGLESEFRSRPNDFRAPIAANASLEGRYDCITFNPNSTSLNSNATMIYNKSSSALKNHTIYVVNGTGGGSEGTAGPDWPHDAMQGYFFGGGSMYLEVEGNRLDGKFVDTDGVVRDQFKIIKDADTFTVPLTDGAVHKPDCECNDAEGYTHYVERTPAGAANLLLSINKSGNSIGTVGEPGFDLSLQGKPGSSLLMSYVKPADYLQSSVNVMNRYWTLKPILKSTANPMSIRHYWKKGVDLNTFFNLSNGPYQVMLDYSYQIISINDDCSPPPIGYERNPVSSTAGQLSPHYNIPKAASYIDKGAWVYRNGTVASPISFKFGTLARATPLPLTSQAFSADYGEFPILMGGTLKCIGGTLSGGFETRDWLGNTGMPAALGTLKVVTLYPNPVQGGSVYFSPALNYNSFTLSTIEGHIIKTTRQPGTLTELDLSSLPAGIYILMSQSETGISQFKLVKY